MAHASVSWACGRHPSMFDPYIEYGPVAVVANDGDTNNEGRSATDNDVEIGDGRLRILPWYGKHTALFAIHHPTRRVHLSSSSHTHPVTVYNSHSLHLQMYSDSLTWSRGTCKRSGCFTWILACNGPLLEPRQREAATRPATDGCDKAWLRQGMAASSAFSSGCSNAWLRHKHSPREADDIVSSTQ